MVVGPNEEVQAWIEIELDAPDLSQLAAYRPALHGPVLCIAGTPESDLELSEIAGVLSDMNGSLDRQQPTRRPDLPGTSSTRSPGGARAGRMRNRRRRFVRSLSIAALVERLGEEVVFGAPPLPPGRVLVSTITQKRWTLRVYSHAVVTDHSVSVTWNQGSDQGRYRCHRSCGCAAVSQTAMPWGRYATFLRRDFHVDVADRAERQNRAISEEELLARIDEPAPLVSALARAG